MDDLKDTSQPSASRKSTKRRMYTLGEGRQDTNTPALRDLENNHFSMEDAKIGENATPMEDEPPKKGSLETEQEKERGMIDTSLRRNVKHTEEVDTSQIRINVPDEEEEEKVEKQERVTRRSPLNKNTHILSSYSFY